MNDKKVVAALNKGIMNKVIERPALYPQAPNRVGNISKLPADANGGRNGTGGVTNVTANKTYISQPKGAQGAPKANGVPLPKITSNGATNKSKTNAGPVSVSQPPKKYAPTNLGFLKDNESKSWKS